MGAAASTGVPAVPATRAEAYAAGFKCIDVDAFEIAQRRAAAPAAAPAPRKLRVVHFNDVYNLLATGDDDSCVGGAARFYTKLKEIRDSDPANPPLVIFGGDLFGPSQVSAVTKGRHMVEMLDTLGVHYGCFGNHEFDFGLKGLEKCLNTSISKYGITTEPSRVQWLCTNVAGADGAPLGRAQKSAVIDWNGVKVGILSVSENWLPGCSKVKSDEYVYRDYVDAAREEAKQLRAAGAEVVLALTHSGIGKDREMMAQIPVEEIDLLCGGHDHDYIRDEALRIVKAGQEWRYLTDVEFSLPAEPCAPGAAALAKCAQVNIGSDIAEDPCVAAIVEKWEGMVALKAAKVIGQAACALDSREEATRWREGELSNWLCDVVAEDFSADAGSQAADLAMLNGYALSGKQLDAAGPVTVGHLLNWFPSLVVCEVVKLTGAEILQSLELGCEKLPGECGPLHHVSSRVAYSIDVAQPAGKRVHSATFDGEAIDAARIFTVACTANMGNGGFGFDWMKAAPRVVDEEFATPVVELCVDWFKRHKGEAIDPKLGRIIIH
ncbi:Metallo-dependent phosphatase-like protein [Pelagophyceae sp. CCMP2097]|nr:Metallo-dependent phosphatase-like protein [Pelagophyceae sp. CCMP2097]|mmetsp:Transcript_2123/g.7527  ORF Transcript_2123/g.7527 Transcript_2123/m.7527 type:complete len:550 (-) Transcript_2123:52-1701(-)